MCINNSFIFNSYALCIYINSNLRESAMLTKYLRATLNQLLRKLEAIYFHAYKMSRYIKGHVSRISHLFNTKAYHLMQPARMKTITRESSRQNATRQKPLVCNDTLCHSNLKRIFECIELGRISLTFNHSRESHGNSS